MSEIPKKAIIEVGSGVVQYVDYTPEEIQQRELDAIQAATELAEREAKAAELAALKASARAKLVNGEKMTPEEAATIVL